MPDSTNFESFSLDQIKEEFIGSQDTAARKAYEFQLSMELLGSSIRQARQERKLTQAELGALVGVQKAQISKLERSASNVTIGTVLRIFDALGARVQFRVELNAENERL